MSDVTTIPGRFRGRLADEAEFQLVGISGPRGAFSFSLDAQCPPRVLLGSGPLCHLRIGDPAASRRHASIELCGSHLLVTDLDSTNGTFVNGVAMLSARLLGGEVLRVGDTKMRVFASRSTTSQPLPVPMGRLVGASVEMRRVFTIARALSMTDVPVLVEGEPGTGKRTLAEAIHDHGHRAAMPLLTLETSGVDPSRLQPALFGAGHGALGLLEQADGGGLIIEEIGALDLQTQARLLGVIEHKQIRRKDGAAMPVDVRLFSCTRRNLDKDAHEGRFREELLLRLASGRIEAPPLRRRDGDLPLLIEHFWAVLRGDPTETPLYLADELADHPWPGNVRELEALVVRTLVARDSPSIPVPATPHPSEDSIERVLGMRLPLPQAREVLVNDFERRYMARVLAENDGNVVRAASAAGVARRYFQLMRARFQKEG